MNLTLKLLCIPHLFDHAGGRLTVRVRQRTKYIVRPEEKRRRESSSFLPPVAFCMHALPPPTHHCVGGKSGVRWECRGGGREGRGRFSSQFTKNIQRRKKQQNARDRGARGGGGTLLHHCISNRNWKRASFKEEGPGVCERRSSPALA